MTTTRWIDSGLAADLWRDGRVETCPVYDMHGHMGPLATIYFPRCEPADMVRSMDEAGAVHFYGHEKISVHKAGQIARRWTFPHRRLHRVAALVKHHLRPGALDAMAG